MKPEAAVEASNAIAQQGPWGLVVFVVVCVILFGAAIVVIFWRVASSTTTALTGVLDKHAKALEGINLQFADHKLNDERLHTATRDLFRDEAETIRKEVTDTRHKLAQAIQVLPTGDDMAQAANTVMQHVTNERLRERAGATSNPTMPAVRPPTRSRPGG
jgi:hypothetical protein